MLVDNPLILASVRRLLKVRLKEMIWIKIKIVVSITLKNLNITLKKFGLGNVFVDYGYS